MKYVGHFHLNVYIYYLLQESCPSLVVENDFRGQCSSLDWRAWRNLHSLGIHVPNTVATDDEGITPSVNIILNRLQLHDEKEKRRVLANKFSLSDAVLKAWTWMDVYQAARMAKRVLKKDTEDEIVEDKVETDDATDKERRMEAVGPNKWLHTLKLTLCFVEVQVGR